MADKPADAGASGGLAGDLALPPAVHRHDYPRPVPLRLSWLPYLLVLAGIVTGLLVAWHSSRDALAGTAVVGGTLLAAALARLVLPPRYAGALRVRSRIYDVLALTALGASVLAIVLTLP